MIDDAGQRIQRPLLAGLDVTDAETAFVLPTGTVSFMLTDVEGSSRRWEHSPEAMAVAIPRQYDLLDKAIVSHGGVRPVEQGEGDSVVGAFSRASDAVAAALDAQRAMASEPWPDGVDLRVRIAVHTGEAQLRDEGNYFGQAVIRCARMRAIGHGGQVLVSDATAGLVADRLAEGVGLVDLGVHRLKDLGRPERVWQLTGPDLAGGFPPLRSLDAFRHNLPLQLTPLIGRLAEVAEISGLLAGERLVTLIGSGGVGKTRLALAVAADVIERFGGGVWLVELAGVTDPGALAAAAMAALGAHQSTRASLTDQLALALGEQPSLLVLDNCEHLLDGVAQLTAALLAANQAVTVLATSREALGVPGEVSWRVPSLATPPPESTPTAPALSQYDAVRLFLDRARRARPSFTVSDANAPAIAQICHRLDGIPLALELAAARCRQMSAERIARDLDDRFRLLTGGARTVLARQQTLAASIDWSHERLDDDESIAFRRLGVFAGWFPLEAAEAIVAAPGDIDAVAVFDLVSRLVDKSLVAAEDGRAGEPRYRLLESLRAYALDRLRAAGEIGPLRETHARWWLGWLEQRFPEIHTDAVLEEVDVVHDNLQAALDWGLDRPEVGLRLLHCLGRAWQCNGRSGDVMAVVDRLLTEDNAGRHGAEWATAVTTVSVLVISARGFADLVVLVERAERIAVALGDPYQAAVARWLMTWDEETCIAAHNEAVEHDEAYIAAVTSLILGLTMANADPVSAAAYLDRAEVGIASGTSRILRDFACEARCGLARATGDLRRCIDLARQLSDSPSTLALEAAVNNLSAAALLCRDRSTLCAAADISARRLAGGSPLTESWVRHRLGLIDGEPSRVEPDLRPDDNGLLTATLHLLAREAVDAGAGDLALEVVRALDRSPSTHAVRAAIEGAAGGDEDKWHEALRLATDHGLRLIVVDALEGIAVVAAASESWAECLRLHGAAQRLRDECDYRWRFGFEQQALDGAIAAARTALDDDVADAAEVEGRALDWRDAAAFAGRARGERRRPRHGWAGLTPTEHQVVTLVAEGLTNPQIAERLLMGRATVKTHLEHIFTKTGIRTRAELAAESTRRTKPTAP